MPFPIALLLTRSQCEQALSALRLERRVLAVGAEVTDIRADQATDRATDRATELTEHQATVTRLTPLVAAMTPGSAEHTLNNRLLVRATRRVEDLTAPTTTTAADPVAAFLKAVDARQQEVQVPELDRAIAEVEARRGALPT